MSRYMEGRVGQTFTGLISGVTAYAVYVTLVDSLVEGMVPVREMPVDRYRFSPHHFTLTAERTGHVYRLGNPVTVRCAAVDVLAPQVTFSLLEGRAAAFGGPDRKYPAGRARQPGLPGRRGAGSRESRSRSRSRR